MRKWEAVALERETASVIPQPGPEKALSTVSSHFLKPSCHGSPKLVDGGRQVVALVSPPLAPIARGSGWGAGKG